MSFSTKYAIVLAGLLTVHPSHNSAQAGAMLPHTIVASPDLKGATAVRSGEIPRATPGSGTLGSGELSKGFHGFGSYDWWITAWWRWALATPARVNPLLDPRATNCDAGRQPRHVRFLGGNFSGGAKDPPVVRRCTVPWGTALFFPILNAVWASTPKPKPGCDVAADPWYGSRPGDRVFKRFLRDVYIPAGKNPNNPPGSLTLTIDGKSIRGLEHLYKRSDVFFNTIIPDDNIFDATLGANCFDRIFLTPNVAWGYHVFIPPLPPGRHTLHWTADATLPILGALHQDVTYHLTVKR